VPPRQECVSISLLCLLVEERELTHALRLAENGTPFTVAGSGTPLRQFIYSRDLAKLFIWQLKGASSPDVTRPCP